MIAMYNDSMYGKWFVYHIGNEFLAVEESRLVSYTFSSFPTMTDIKEEELDRLGTEFQRADFWRV